MTCDAPLKRTLPIRHPFNSTMSGMRRDSILRSAAGLVLCLVMTAGPTAAEVTHGPMLGHVTESSVRVWVRTDHPERVTIRCGENETSLTAASTEIETELASDNTGWSTLQGLKPQTRYYFQPFIGDQPSGPAGTFQTLPSAGAYRNAEYNRKGLFNFNFEAGSCANQNPEHGIGPSLPLYTTMLDNIADDVSFAIMNGDWLYEEEREYPLADWRRQVGAAPAEVPNHVQIAPTIVGVWENYKTYLSRAANLSEWHRRVPSYFTFDDHELVNDIRGCGTIGFRERRTVFRDIGISAWFDYLGWANPVETDQPVHFGRAQLSAGSDLLVDRQADFRSLPLDQMANLHVHWGTPTAGVNDMQYDDLAAGDPNARVYAIEEVLGPNRLRIRPPAVADGTASYSIGRKSYGSFRVANCEYFLLDLKTYREMHDPTDPMKPGLTMLGEQQKQWLFDSMRSSGADFFFIVSSVNFMIPHSGAGGFEMAEGKDEAWTALMVEREEVLQFWEELQKPVIILTADLHNSFAIKITDLIWEFGCGPHNSVNHVPQNDEGNRPATGLFQSGPRQCDIRWSSYILPDVPRPQRMYPHYCKISVKNVFNMPQQLGGERWVAFPNPQVVLQFFDGRTGELEYAEAISTKRAPLE